MNPIATTLLFLTLLIAGASSWAVTLSPAVRAEIEHLLAYVENSGCQFNRNGTWHDSRDASAHLAQKERYLEKRGEIARAEDFIAKAATKSSVTGRPYTVRCGSEPAVASNEWLGAALKQFRQEKS